MCPHQRFHYTLAVHRGKGENPHAHLMISERVNDGIERVDQRGAGCPIRWPCIAGRGRTPMPT